MSRRRECCFLFLKIKMIMEQREIKFRAWDNRRKRMMTPFIIFEKHPADGLITEKTNWHDENDMRDEWDTSNQVNELMQYTGLKDKNGVEIYEGDVVQSLSKKFDGMNSKGKIIWKGFAWYWEGYFGFVALNRPENLEIIGNIYENPELLK